MASDEQRPPPFLSGAPSKVAGVCRPPGTKSGATRRRRLQQALIPGLTIAVSTTMLIWLVTDPMLGAVLDLLHSLRPRPLLMALALVPVLQWLRGWRFAILLRRSVDLPCSQHFKLAAQLSFLNLALPFKIGDFSFPLLARKTVGTALLPGTVAIVWCRLNDLCVMVAILAFCGTLLLVPEHHPEYRLALIAFAVACLLLPLAVAPLIGLLRSWRGFDRLLDLLPAGAQLDYGHGASLAVTVAIWTTHSLIACLAVSAIASHVSVAAVAFASAASNLAFAFPVTGVAGLGPPQAAWAATLHLSGASWHIAIATALVVYGCILVGAMLTAAATTFWPHQAVAAAARLARAQRVGTGLSPR